MQKLILFILFYQIIFSVFYTRSKFFVCHFRIAHIHVFFALKMRTFATILIFIFPTTDVQWTFVSTTIKYNSVGGIAAFTLCVIATIGAISTAHTYILHNFILNL